MLMYFGNTRIPVSITNPRRNSHAEHSHLIRRTRACFADFLGSLFRWTIDHSASPVHPWSRRYNSLRSSGLQIVRRRLAGPSIGNNLERDFLALVETVHPGAFHRADMHKDILAAVFGLNEAVALLAIKPLHCSLHHGSIFLHVLDKPRANAAGFVREAI